ncbi:MAG: N-acyl-D-amino-acid deacylase family protein [Streptosporangiaceae bacterium]
MAERILLRGGLVADGIGSRVDRADVLVDGASIAAIGLAGASPGDCQVIDLAPGSVVCPGFIDAHVHAEGPLLAAGRVDGALAQGVTTLVVGQDGESWIGATAATARYLNRYFAPVNGVLEPARDPGVAEFGVGEFGPAEFGVAEFGVAVAGRLAQNVAVLASQGTIRHNVAGLAPGPLEVGQLAAARTQVERALAEGAVGLSSGLDYLPSRYGQAAEIAEIARPVGAAGRPYVSHLRDYGGGVTAALAELAEVGAGSGARVHASHLWGDPADLAAAFHAAEGRGVAVSFDMYPYRMASTILADLLLPADLQAGGPEATVAALADPARRAVLLAGEGLTDARLAGVFLGCLPDRLARFAGQSVADAAAASGRPAGEWVLDLLVSADLNVGGHLDRPELTDRDLAAIADDPRFCAGSDGIYQGQYPHPRGFGAFAELAGHFLRGDPQAGYQKIARHLAAAAADAYGLRDRGRLAPGMAADICVIGPGGLVARASYEHPAEHAAGVDLVLVNGGIVWRGGQPAAATPGRLVS